MMVVPVEFADARLAVIIDMEGRQATGRAEVTFTVTQRGRPLLDMVPTPTSIGVDGRALPLSAFPEVPPPSPYREPW